MSLSDDEALFDDIYGEEEAKLETKPAPGTEEEIKPKEEDAKPKEEESADAEKGEIKNESTSEDKPKSEETENKSQVSIDQESSTPLVANATSQTAQETTTFSTPSSAPAPQAPGTIRKADLSRDAGKMFVGGLDWDTTEEKFRQYFSKFGEVVDYTIMRDQNGRSRGFGFLTFSSKEPVNEILKTQHILDGKVIDPKRAIPREEQDKTGKIFVGGIAPEVRPHEFEAFFSQFGEIIDAQLMLDKDTGKSRGFGFVTFDSPDAVDKVCVGKYLDFNGRQIEVKRAEPRGPQQQQNHIQQQQQRIMQQQGMQGGAGMYGGVSQEAMADYWQRMQQYWAQVQQQQGANQDPAVAAQMAAYTQQFQQYQQQMAAMGGAAAPSGDAPQLPQGPAAGSDSGLPKGPRSDFNQNQGFNQNYNQGGYNNNRGDRGGYNNQGFRGRGRGNYRGGYNNNRGGRGGFHPYNRNNNNYGHNNYNNNHGYGNNNYGNNNYGGNNNNDNSQGAGSSGDANGGGDA